MRFFLKLCSIVILAVVFVSLVASQACGPDGYDFSSLSSATSLRATTGGYTYILNPCGLIKDDSSCSALGASVSACQKGGTSNDIGDFNSQVTVWSQYNIAGLNVVDLLLNGSPTCWQPTGTVPYNSNVLFTCGPDGQPMQVATQQGQCWFNFTVITSLACGGGGPSSSHGLSGGWVFIIILSVVVPLYVAVGCVYKAKKLGASGIEMCPNIEFWRDLPSLLKDGIKFTWAKLRGLCGGSTTNTGSYDSM